MAHRGSPWTALAFLYALHRWLRARIDDVLLADAAFVSVALGSLLYGYALLFVSTTASAAAAFGYRMLDGKLMVGPEVTATTQLNSKATGRVSFLDREMMRTLERERSLKQSGQVTSSSDPRVVEFRGADYFLTGKLDGMTTRTSAGTSDYVLYSFRLTNARTSEIVWEDTAEVKKQGLEDAAYR